MNVVRATSWSAVDILSGRLIQFAVSVVLARLLLPAEFGLFAMLAVFQGVATLFIDSGFSAALIQKRDTTRDQESAVFWFNLASALAVALLLGLSGPLIARFFDQPLLRSLVWPMAIALFVNSAKNVQIALLSRRLDFRTLSSVNIISALISGVVAIWLAASGAGVWSLAWFVVAGAVTSAAGLWLLNPWRPILAFRPSVLRPLLQYGSFLMLSGFLDQLYRQMSSLLIGRFYTASDLGFYSRADTTRNIPSTMVGGIVNRVAFPALSAVQEDRERLRNGVRRATQAMMIVNVPAMAGMVVAARPVILGVFGDQWSAAIPYLQILALAGMLWPVQHINVNVLMAQGHSKRVLRLQSIKTAIGLSLVGGAALVSVPALAWAQVVFSVLAVVVSAWYASRTIGYSLLRQLADLWQIAAASLAAAGAVWFLSDWTAMLQSRLLELTLLATTGTVVLAVASVVLRVPIVDEYLRGFLRRRGKSNRIQADRDS